MITPAPPLPTNRASILAKLASNDPVDLIVIGGGASGLGVALDAVLRGLKVVLLESHDFAKGTSSRATKLVHGGVRYLAQGNIPLVREALHERSTLLQNAPHLVSPLAFVMPSFSCWETPFYGIGLKMYDALAGKAGLGPTQFMSARATHSCLPGVKMAGLKGGVKYWDAQFDDARLALALARSVAAQGGLVVNYCPMTELLHEDGRVVGVRCTDLETDTDYTVRAKCVVNATGVWVDEIRHKDDLAAGRVTVPMVSPSQGVHLVVDASFLPGQHALLVPKTRDGRVLFAVPWLGKVILGTTDTPRHDLAREPLPFADEVAFILQEAAKYLARPPSRADVRSVWVGLRPLVSAPATDNGHTKRISREHTVVVSQSGLVTVTGGKWTTYRAMAEDVLNKCVESGLLDQLPASRTASFALVGAPVVSGSTVSATDAVTCIANAPGLAAYGAEASYVQALDGQDHELAYGLTAAMVRYAVRYEYARTTEDVLARRSRLLFLDAALAGRIAGQVADLVQQETGHDPQLESFLILAKQYHTLP
ncbi:MAG: glycerol-3-phosphate dehydrogenase/oxidase [Burkholderiaceae bacterium]|nr:glycerol-3-phosphate dehydrogenase/oxidase [Burkholderiaceae bacterium]